MFAGVGGVASVVRGYVNDPEGGEWAEVVVPHVSDWAYRDRVEQIGSYHWNTSIHRQRAIIETLSTKINELVREIEALRTQIRRDDTERNEPTTPVEEASAGEAGFIVTAVDTHAGEITVSRERVDRDIADTRRDLEELRARIRDEHEIRTRHDEIRRRAELMVMTDQEREMSRAELRRIMELAPDRPEVFQRELEDREQIWAEADRDPDEPAPMVADNELLSALGVTGHVHRGGELGNARVLVPRGTFGDGSSV